MKNQKLTSFFNITLAKMIFFTFTLFPFVLPMSRCEYLQCKMGGIPRFHKYFYRLSNYGYSINKVLADMERNILKLLAGYCEDKYKNTNMNTNN